MIVRMKITTRQISCDHNHNYHTYLEFNFPKNDEILQIVRNKAPELVDELNPQYLGSNRIRSDDEVLSSAARGLLSEICSKKILETEIEKRNLTAELIESEGLIETPDGTTQIDLQLGIDGKKFDLEIRSSCVRNGTEFGITSGYFNILGWYVHQTKRFEPPKDFYLMYLFPFDAKHTLSKFDDGFVMHFVGGATKTMLEGPLGRYTNLKQAGMKCCGISPICAGLDSSQIIEKMLETEKRSLI